MTYRFFLSKKPISFNQKRRDARKDDLKKEAEEVLTRRYGSAIPQIEEKLYGIVFHFCRTRTRLDADNISKPTWDALKGLLYEDDKQVVLRIASSINLSDEEIISLDFTGLDDELTDQLNESIINNEHTIFIECGNFENEMLSFNMIQNEN